jgi:hypothetical protein
VKPVTVVTNPAGLTVAVSYAGVANAPSAVGSYSVEAVVVASNYQGSATGTLVIEPRRHELIVAAAPVEGGVVSGGGLFDEGTLAAITATAADGWRFTGWIGEGVTDADNPDTTVTMDASRSVTAAFVRLTAFENWAAGHGLEDAAAGVSADPDGDGLVNLLVYATGTSPTTAGASLITIGQFNGMLTLSFPRIADPALTYTVEASDDLGGSWAPVAASGNPSTGADNVAGNITMIDTAELATHPRRFLRLRISL